MAAALVVSLLFAAVAAAGATATGREREEGRARMAADGPSVPRKSPERGPAAVPRLGSCAAELHAFKSALRAEGGFPIPANGENVDFVEGGSPDDEFFSLGRLAQEELAERYPHPRGGGVVCQTGFNYGTSAFAFLCATRATQVFSWDLGSHDYVPMASDLIRARFPGRHTIILGDSQVTLPAEAAAADAAAASDRGESAMRPPRCDVVFVDGGHYSEMAAADIQNFARLAVPGALLMVDDCARGGGGIVGGVYEEAVRKGMVSEVDASWGGGGVAAATTVRRHFSLDRDVCVGRFPAEPPAPSAWSRFLRSTEGLWR